MSIFKQTKPSGKLVSGTTQQQAYDIEKECLTLLERNYECTCGMNVRHFPVILSCDDEACTFKLTDCGFEVFDNRHNTYFFSYITDYERQVDCIIQNLKKNNIYHLDIHPAAKEYGRNICIKDGILSLIDFDVAAIGTDFWPPKLQVLYNRILLPGKDYYESLKEHLLNYKTSMP